VLKKILVTTSSFAAEGNIPLREIEASGFKIKFNPHGRRLSEDEAIEFLSDPSVVGMIAGVEPLTKKVLKNAPSLRVISRCGTGMDSVDLAAATELGIAVLNTPNAPVQSTAELTVGLILSVARRIAEADRNLRANIWKPLPGPLLGEASIGIIGLGRVGTTVAGIMQAFGSRVLGYDPVNVTDTQSIEQVSFNTLLAEADIISIHVPLSPSTRNLIGAKEIATMKIGAILINAARGGLVDEGAIAEALESGHLAGAGLDVYAEEPYSGPLTTFEQVVLTAHMGGTAREARAIMEQEAADNLRQGLQKAGVWS
jgi:D-3-phosphoglycerate dehydrogenase